LPSWLELRLKFGQKLQFHNSNQLGWNYGWKVPLKHSFRVQTNLVGTMAREFISNTDSQFKPTWLELWLKHYFETQFQSPNQLAKLVGTQAKTTFETEFQSSQMMW